MYSILSEFDLNCCCVASDGITSWAHLRAVKALVTRANLVDLRCWSPTFEERALKYAERGFALAFYTDLNFDVDNLILTIRDEQGTDVPVTKTNIGECMKGTTGLAHLLYAHQACKLGAEWEPSRSRKKRTGSFDGKRSGLSSTIT
jgi:hypothetical protein